MNLIETQLQDQGLYLGLYFSPEINIKKKNEIWNLLSGLSINSIAAVALFLSAFIVKKGFFADGIARQ